MNEKVTLGQTGIEITPLGMGLMQWGDINLSSDQYKGEIDEVQSMFKAALDRGINFFDTAEMYGSGKSEIHLGRCLKALAPDIVIATKFMPFPWRLSKGELKSALRKSLKRMGIDHVDLYQMHWPFPPVPIATWMDAMSDVVADGLVRAVGVSNYSTHQMQLAFDSLARHKIPLASNQVKYSLLDRHPDTSGLVEFCNQLKITIIAYSPLEKGVLTGKYNRNNLPRGLLTWRYNKSFMTKIEPLLSLMRYIGESHGSKSIPMVALNWLMSKGAVPIPGARNLKQAGENAGALGWQLNEEEINQLDKLSLQLAQ